MPLVIDTNFCNRNCILLISSRLPYLARGWADRVSDGGLQRIKHNEITLFCYIHMKYFSFFFVKKREIIFRRHFILPTMTLFNIAGIVRCFLGNFASASPTPPSPSQSSESSPFTLASFQLFNSFVDPRNGTTGNLSSSIQDPQEKYIRPNSCPGLSGHVAQ